MTPPDAASEDESSEGADTPRPASRKLAADAPTVPRVPVEAPDDESEELLALGAAEFTDELAMGEADEDDDEPVFGLSFAVGVQKQSQAEDPTGAWDLSDLQELVVEEKKGDFGGDGSSARDDVIVMDEDFDDDEHDVIMAVWGIDGEGGEVEVGARVRRRAPPVPRHYLPYGLIAAGLGALLIVAMVGIVGALLVALVTGPPVVVEPVDPSTLPKVEIERVDLDAEKEKTADEILEEVLGEEDE